MNSPGHSANILSAASARSASAVTLGAPTMRDRDAATYTTVFGARR